MLKARKKKTNTRPDRPEYLALLVAELLEVKSRDYKKQLLANLANFAYDPYNYNYLRELNVIDLFLKYLSDTDETLVHFAISGLCNLSLDPKNKDYILANDGVKIIMRLLENKNENILIPAVTTLMFLVTPQSKDEITAVNNIKCMIKLTRGKNNRIKNLAQIFLSDYCSNEQVKIAQEILEKSVEDIPLPNS